MMITNKKSMTEITLKEKQNSFYFIRILLHLLSNVQKDRLNKSNQRYNSMISKEFDIYDLIRIK
jgi:hypothetical protein